MSPFSRRRMVGKRRKGTWNALLRPEVALKCEAQEHWKFKWEAYSKKWWTSLGRLISSGANEYHGGTTWSHVCEGLVSLQLHRIPPAASWGDRRTQLKLQWCLRRRSIESVKTVLIWLLSYAYDRLIDQALFALHQVGNCVRVGKLTPIFSVLRGDFSVFKSRFLNTCFL